MADNPLDPKGAKAEAKAAKARAKAMRPWYKKKRWWALGVVALIIIAAIAGGSGTDKTGTSDQAGQTKTTKTARVGDKARDGKFEFTVTKVECGKSRVGSADFGKNAQGQYCFVHLTVENIGNESQTMFGNNQILFDTQGRKFEADTEAALYVENSKAIFEEINPGNSITGFIIYDVPKAGFTPAKVELHDSAFSGGVVVTL